MIDALHTFYQKSKQYSDIPNELFHKYNVKKGLRNDDGTGVRVGLTRIADVVGLDEYGNGSRNFCRIQ